MINAIKRLVQSNDLLHSASMSIYMKLVFRRSVRRRALDKGLVVDFQDDHIDVRDGNRVIRSSTRHAIYIFDMVDNFDFFFEAVEPTSSQGTALVDYSKPQSHRVRGFDLHPIFFPSIAEPVETTTQYIEFASLTEGSVAIDLGAYAGLTSILFREQCGETGKVIAVEADPTNIDAVRRNLAAYEHSTGRSIELLEGAVWIHNDGIRFSTEGSMGSSATDIVGNRTGEARLVPSWTLSALVNRFDLHRVDFIKCDIEGGEAVIFDDTKFFEQHRPRMIVEVHAISGKMTTEKVMSALSRVDYGCRQVPQNGFDLPLLECWPN
jgi:FkbM family methyltransferase